MKKNRRGAIFCLLLVALLLFATLFPAFGASETFDGDFSRPGAGATVTVSAVRALSSLGFTLSDTESAYLSSTVPVWLRYDNRIPSASVTTHYVDGTLTVYAKPYSYLAKNGESVLFTPVAVTVADATRPLTLSDGSYTAVFSDLAEDPSLSVTVKYETTFRIPKATVAALSNLAYDEAVRIRDSYLAAYETYRAEKAAYDGAVRDYDAYLAALAEYREARLAYEGYLAAEALYREDLAAYEKYLADMEEYEREEEAYRRYLSEMEEYNRRVAAYNAYLAELETYRSDLDAYHAYLAALETVRSQLSYMNLAKTLKAHACMIYASLQGPTVKAVLENEEILTGKIVDADPYAISLAGDSTERLITILKEYFSLATDEEKYGYYTLNYTEIVNNYVNLFRALDSLYRVRNVRAILIKEGKAEKYVALLAELYTVSHLLSDSAIPNFEESGYLDGTYRIQHWDSAYADRYLTPAEVLEGTTYPSVDSAVGTPLPTGYPTQVAEPVPPEPTEDPTGQKPAECYRPLPLAPRTEPTPPTPVPAPTEPPAVQKPTDPPAAPKLTVSERGLYAALEDGTLTRRPAPDEDAAIVGTAEVGKKVFDLRTVTVLFLDGEDGELLYRTTVDRGSAAIYDGETIPARPEDENGRYTFDGWMYRDGTPADLSSCEEDMTVIPHFAVTPKYRVTFRTETGDTVLTVLRGEAARYPDAPPEKAADPATVYTFDGWVREDGTPADLSSVEGDLLVFPHFAATPRTYTVTFSLDGTLTTALFRYGETPALPFSVPTTRDGDEIRAYAGLSPAPVPVTEDAAYTVLFSRTPLFPLSDGSAAPVRYEDGTLTVDATADSARTLPLASLYGFFSDARGLCVRFDGVTLTFSYSALTALKEAAPDALFAACEEDTLRFSFTEGGEETSLSLGADVAFAVTAGTGNRRLSVENGKKTYVKFTSDGDFLRFSATSTKRYVYAAEYGINAVPDGNVAFSVPDATFLPGEYVPFTYTLSEGFALSSLTIRDRGGESVAYDGKGFFMPEGGVDIVAATRPLVYKITFLAGGVPVKEYTVPYGGMPEPPLVPNRAPGASFTYTFVGWSEEISPAYGDKTYEAVYESTPRPEKEENTFGGFLFRLLARLLRTVSDVFCRLFGIS